MALTFNNGTGVLCECGCGQEVGVASFTDPTKGYVKGEPLRFVRFHHLRLIPKKEKLDGTLSEHLCECGCGERVRMRGTRPYRFVLGHGRRKRGYAIDGDTGCWVSKKTPDATGYLQDTEFSTLHRRIYVETHGPLPDGYHVHHRCQNRHCINPEHLEALSHAEHFHIKGHGHTKLSWDEVHEIRRRAADGEVKCRIAESFGISPSNLTAIIQEKSWRSPLTQ